MADSEKVELRLDPKNANLGTPRGAELLKESIESCGLGRGIVADKKGTIIAGNKTYGAAKAMGFETEVVETTGEELVVVQRTDLDLLEDPKARRLAYYDNRVQELDLSWSGPQIQSDLLAGVDVGMAFFPEELSALASVDLSPQDAVKLEPTVDPLAPAPETETKPVKPKTAGPSDFVLTFNTIEQQLKWGAFMRRLRERYPDLVSPAARLAAHLTEVGVKA
jgi:hypothetical protein